MFNGSMTQPAPQPAPTSGGLDMNQLNELLGGFKKDIMSGIDDRFSSFQPSPAYEPTDYSGQFGGLEDKIAGLEQQLSSIPQPAGVDYDKIGSLVSDQVNQAVGGLNIPQYEPPDLSGIQNQIGQINDRFNNFSAPGVDYGKIGGMIDNKIGSIPQPDGVNLDPLMGRLDQLEGKIGSQPGVDLSGIEGRLDQFGSRLDGLNTQPDLSSLTGRLDDLSGRFDGLSTQPDLSPIQDQIGQLNSRFDGFMSNDRSDELIGEFQGIKDMIGGINTQPDLSPIEERLGGLDETIQGLRDMPGTDLSPISGRLDQLNERFGGFDQQIKDLGSSIAQPQPVDLTGIENKLDMGFNDQREVLGNLRTEPDLSLITDQLNNINQNLDQQAQQPQGPDGFTTFMNDMVDDGTVTWGGNDFDLTGLLTNDGPGVGNIGGGGSLPGQGVTPGLDNGWTPPPINPQPQPQPAPTPQPQPGPAPVQDEMDWMRYGRDYGEVDFNVGGTAGGPVGGGFQQPGGGIDLNRMLQNLGLFS